MLEQSLLSCIVENSRDGVRIERLPYGDFVGSNFCDLVCSICQRKVSDFPLRLTVYKARIVDPFQCKKVSDILI